MAKKDVSRHDTQEGDCKIAYTYMVSLIDACLCARPPGNAVLHNKATKHLRELCTAEYARGRADVFIEAVDLGAALVRPVQCSVCNGQGCYITSAEGGRVQLTCEHCKGQGVLNQEVKQCPL